MVVEEALLLMNHTPLRDDRTAATHHASESALRQWHVLQSYATVDGEVIYALLTLLYQGVAEDFPSEVFCLSVHLFESLVHWHCAYGNRTVAKYPFACLVYVLAR